jgi:hypothetical protein
VRAREEYRRREDERERKRMREREQGVLVASLGGLLDLKRQAGGGVGGELLLCHAPTREKTKGIFQLAPWALVFFWKFLKVAHNCDVL